MTNPNTKKSEMQDGFHIGAIWVKLPVQLLDSPTFCMLSPEAQLFYCKTLMLAGRLDNGGLLAENDKALTLKQIAFSLRSDVRTAEALFTELQDADYLEYQHNTWGVSRWTTEQGATPYSKKKEQWRESKRKRRAEIFSRNDENFQELKSDSDSDSEQNRTESEQNRTEVQLDIARCPIGQNDRLTEEASSISSSIEDSLPSKEKYPEEWSILLEEERKLAAFFRDLAGVVATEKDFHALSGMMEESTGISDGDLQTIIRDCVLYSQSVGEPPKTVRFFKNIFAMQIKIHASGGKAVKLATIDDFPVNVRDLLGTYIQTTGLTPLTSDIATWAKEAEIWLLKGYTAGDVEKTVQRMGKRGLTIARPSSISGVLGSTHNEKEEYPEFDASKLL